jgi:hypothetical protein
MPLQGSFERITRTRIESRFGWLRYGLNRPSRPERQVELQRDVHKAKQSTFDFTNLAMPPQKS